MESRTSRPKQKRERERQIREKQKRTREAMSKLVFDSIEAKNVYLWNSLINGHVKNHDFYQALALFHEMGRSHHDNVLPDGYTLATISKVSGELEELVFGKLIHGKSIRIGFMSDIVVANSVMSMYSRCGEFEDAIKVFDEMPQRNEGEFFSKNGYPKMPFPHGWKGNAGLYAVGFTKRELSSASSDAMKIAQDIGEVWKQETKQKKQHTTACHRRCISQF